MWEEIARKLLSKSVMINAILSVLIPWGVSKTNEALHRNGDPPWKKDKE
ncbi:hypothetical protein [Paenibacillus thalictri]|nr:hypothetical protein [Paenibacillus thalictri]